jgi:methionyl-tRNA formyltransferase
MEEIYKCGGKLDAVMTLPDDRARAKSGRVYLDDFCAATGVPLAKFANINDLAAVSWIQQMKLDWLLIIGWSQIARSELLAAVERGAIGMHPTLLPEGRGRSAIPWTILKGLSVTGVSMFQLDEGVDSGPLLGQRRVSVAERETATTLYRKVERAHRGLIRDTWPALVSDQITLVPQDDSLATVWPGRTPADGRLYPSMSVLEADRLIRAVTRPYPGAFFDVGRKRLRIWNATPAAFASARETGVILQFADGELIALDVEEEEVTE